VSSKQECGHRRPGVGGTGLRGSVILVTGVAILALLAGCDSPIEAVQIQVTHRMYSGFHEQVTAKPGQRFQIGDTDMMGRIVGFVPDFAMDDKSMKVISRSDLPRNPAIQIEVSQADTLVEKAWAFMKGSPPHFSRKSMLAFEIEQVFWKPGHAPADSSAATDTTIVVE
jgi:hypothetical protein